LVNFDLLTGRVFYALLPNKNFETQNRIASKIKAFSVFGIVYKHDERICFFGVKFWRRTH